MRLDSFGFGWRSRLALITFTTLSFLILTGGCFSKDSRKDSTPEAVTEIPKSNPSPDFKIDKNGLSAAIVRLETEKGTIRFKFYSEDAPQTVKRFTELIQSGFYNGLNFHRVEPGFVVQGGDPKGNGTGGSGQNIPAEFNNRKHREGTVAMARSADPNSADSQFYITLGTFPHLDNNYTVFGKVTDGIQVAHKLKPGDKINFMVIE